MSLALTLISLLILLVSLCFHEMSHAWMANRLGDPTARLLGRLTMNPVKHVDPMGTIALPLLLSFLHLPVFGWAKPVPYNPRNLRQPRRDSALISAAGPASNIFLALLGVVLFRLLGAATATEGSALDFVGNALMIAVLLNLTLAFFNLIPIPPLDGGGVLLGLLPRSMDHLALFLRQYGLFFFIFLIYTGASRVFTEPAYSLTLLLLGLSP